MTLDSYLEEFDHRDWEEPTDGTVRFALLGLGWWTREEAIPAIEASDYCTASVAVSGTIEKAQRVAEETDSITSGITYEEFHEGAAADEYDAVYVCTPNATHLPLVETAADYGKDVLCEKPMEATADRARRMVEHCEDRGVNLMIAYRMQTEPAVRRAKELVSDGAIGDPIHVHGHMSDDLPELIPDPDQWRLDPELSGGTTLNDVGIYPMNTTRFVLEADPTAVYASTESLSEFFGGQDEHVAFQLEFPGGVTASCTASHNAHNCSHLKVIGSAGQVTVEPVFFPWVDRSVHVLVGGTKSEISFEQRNQMTEEFDYFANCLLTDRRPFPDGDHGLTDIETIEAAYESAETDGRIEL